MILGHLVVSEMKEMLKEKKIQKKKEKNYASVSKRHRYQVKEILIIKTVTF
jgi:hypothetical protein